jgi:hypothetical protein
MTPAVASAHLATQCQLRSSSHCDLRPYGRACARVSRRSSLRGGQSPSRISGVIAQKGDRFTPRVGYSWRRLSLPSGPPASTPAPSCVSPSASKTSSKTTPASGTTCPWARAACILTSSRPSVERIVSARGEGLAARRHRRCQQIRRRFDHHPRARQQSFRAGASLHVRRRAADPERRAAPVPAGSRVPGKGDRAVRVWRRVHEHHAQKNCFGFRRVGPFARVSW